MTYQQRVRECESKKRVLQRMGLTPKEYEIRVQALAKKHGV